MKTGRMLFALVSAAILAGWTTQPNELAADQYRIRHKGAVLCTEHAMLIEFVNGQCFNARVCHTKDTNGKNIDICASHRYTDPQTGAEQTRSFPECDCRNGRLKAP